MRWHTTSTRRHLLQPCSCKLLSFWVGNVALAISLLDGGLRTADATFRTGLKPASLLASPSAVWVCLLPFRFSARETWFIVWVGLRGAVPVALALLPLMAGTPQAGVLFNIAFLVVVTSLLLQGTTIGLMARWLGVAMPEANDAVQTRAFFRDFSLDTSTPVGSICAFYNLPAVKDAQQPLGPWMATELRRPPVVGDSVTWGSATLVVRALDEGLITRVGMGLKP